MKIEMNILPLGYGLSLVGFTVMRKLGLARFLKPHSIVIALAAFITIMAFVFAELELLPLHPGDGIFDPLVLFLQSVTLSVSLFVRKEIKTKELTILVMVITLMSLLSIHPNCQDKRTLVVLGVLSLVVFLFGIAKFTSTAVAKTRPVWLLFNWSLFGLFTSWSCQTNLVMYAFTGLCSMWIVKLQHPILGDTFITPVDVNPA
jgi:hypothetical protein